MAVTSVPLAFQLARYPALRPLIEHLLPRRVIRASLRNVYGDPERVDDWTMPILSVAGPTAMLWSWRDASGAFLAALPAGVMIENRIFRQADFNSVSIANLLEALRDGVILVVRANKTGRGLVKQAAEEDLKNS